MIRSVEETARLIGERPGTSAGGPNEPVIAPVGGVRSVLRFDWLGGPSVVAKLYEDDSGAATFAAQRALAAQVGPGSPHLAIPDALLYDTASRILLRGGELFVIGVAVEVADGRPELREAFVRKRLPRGACRRHCNSTASACRLVT